MLELLALLAIPVILIPCFLIYAWKRNYQGVLRVSTEVVAYDKLQFASILDYDRYSMIIKGKRTLIISGEFHYWRVPDRDRWNEILTTYKSAGLNTIRIYFHWGYHSSRQGSYDFTGNRDIAYLLNICKELGLFVMVAPGPYICAGGGFPVWLLAKRDVRMRHGSNSFWKRWDQEYAEYCREWFNAILPLFVKHQITLDSENGCIIALQGS